MGDASLEEKGIEAGLTRAELDKHGAYMSG